MPLTVLSDKDVSRILHSLTRNDVLRLQETLADALHWYSTTSDANDCGSDYQPDRIVTNRKDGSTSIYMPASGLTCHGVKVVNLAPLDSNDPSTLLGKLDINASTPRASISSTSSGSSTSSDSSTQGSGLSLQQTSSYTPSAASTAVASTTSSEDAASTIRGSLTLLDANGSTVGLINAEEVTAFRTALASMILFTKRNSVHDVTIFGAGKQAYWHIRLAMLLRGAEIHHLNVITRNFETARRCFERLYDPFPEDEVYDNCLCNIFDHARFRSTILTPAHTEYPRLLKEAVRASHVLITTTPSTTPLFPPKYLTNPGGRVHGRYIISIGSYKPHMIELHPEIVREAVAVPPASSHNDSSKHHHLHFHQRRQREGGAVVVDTVTGALREAGEIIQAGLEPEQVVELGELFMLKRDAASERRAAAAHAAQTPAPPTKEAGRKGSVFGKFGDFHPFGHGHAAAKAEKPQGCHLADQGGLRDWLSKGNVIYKSVGLGLMDVVVGGELVKLAREKGIGTFIEDF